MPLRGSNAGIPKVAPDTTPSFTMCSRDGVLCYVTVCCFVDWPAMSLQPKKMSSLATLLFSRKHIRLKGILPPKSNKYFSTNLLMVTKCASRTEPLLGTLLKRRTCFRSVGVFLQISIILGNATIVFLHWRDRFAQPRGRTANLPNFLNSSDELGWTG